MSKLSGVRVIEIPKFRAVSSGLLTFDEIFGECGFDRWMQQNDRLLKKGTIYECVDFMWHEGEKSVWIWAVEDWVTEADAVPYELIEFEGGIYVVATADENDGADLWEVAGIMSQWIQNSGVLESDDRPGHRGMGHRIGCGAIQEVLGMAQQEIFFPVKFKKQ